MPDHQTIDLPRGITDEALENFFGKEQDHSHRIELYKLQAAVLIVVVYLLSPAIVFGAGVFLVVKVPGVSDLILPIMIAISTLISGLLLQSIKDILSNVLTEKDRRHLHLQND